MSKFFKRLGTSKLRYQFDLLLQEARLDVPVVGPIMLVLRRGRGGRGSRRRQAHRDERHGEHRGWSAASE